jgi:hypothetical protein
VRIFTLLLLISFQSFAQTEKIDSATYLQLKQDLQFADAPFACPSMKSLVMERKTRRNSIYPKKIVIKMLNGKTIAKYKYNVEKGVLISRELKGKSMVMGSWLTATYFYANEGKTLSMVDYKLYENTRTGLSEVTEKIKTIENNQTVSTQTSKFSYVVPPPPSVDVFENTNSTQNISVNSGVSCNQYYHWFTDSCDRIEQRFNQRKQLVERLYYDEYNNLLGAIRFHYSGSLLSRVELLDANYQFKKQEIISYDSQGNVVNRKALNSCLKK